MQGGSIPLFKLHHSKKVWGSVRGQVARKAVAPRRRVPGAATVTRFSHPMRRRPVLARPALSRAWTDATAFLGDAHRHEIGGEMAAR